MKIKKGDLVLVSVGKDKGKTGKVIQFLSKNGKIKVEGVNIRKKAVKPSTKNPAGGIIEIAAAMESSNLVVVCPRCNKPARIGYSMTKDGKVRNCKRCQEKI